MLTRVGGSGRLGRRVNGSNTSFIGKKMNKIINKREDCVHLLDGDKSVMQGTCRRCGVIVYACINCFSEGYRPPNCACLNGPLVN